jgi:rhodanese-related sulfurtransferase
VPISFGRKSNLPVSRAADLIISQPGKATSWASSQPQLAMRFPETKIPARLVDLRSPAEFRAGFLPGSYNVPDAHCWEAAQAIGLFDGRQVYFLADDSEQLTLCEQFSELGKGSELAGWFGTDALDAWRKAIVQIGRLEAISADTLTIRLAGWNTIILDILESDSRDCGSVHPSALRFHLNQLPLSLDGLPVETSVCITARSLGISSFAASLMWNFGFHKTSYLLRSEAEHQCSTDFPGFPNI